MRVLFLDIDGVLNSTRTSVAHGGYPHELTHTEAFDWVAIKLLQRLCDSSGIQVVLSSAWRLTHDYKDVAKAFDLPIIDRTPSLLGCRGDEIQNWLDNHVEVTNYAILDDDPDMLESQEPHFIHTRGSEGMTWADFSRLCQIFGESPFSGEVRQRNWRETKLAWESGQ
ncbi:MAG: hypothetical protein JNM01_12090 [Delftia acidovorans]|nr:hypothetical protein [Delftia acidovorans]